MSVKANTAIIKDAIMRDGPITRSELADLTGLSTERIQRYVRVMRCKGELICSLDGDWTYYYPNTIDDAKLMLEALMVRYHDTFRFMSLLQKHIEIKSNGVIRYNNLPDIDYEYEREKKSTEEVF